MVLKKFARTVLALTVGIFLVYLVLGIPYKTEAMYGTKGEVTFNNGHWTCTGAGDECDL